MVSRPVAVLDPVAPLTEIVEALERALAGSGPALVPAGARPRAQLPSHVDDDIALLLPTSGSTGSAKLVLLPAEALLASARATHERIGPPGRWLLALPLSHVAGWQVLVRSLLAPARCQLPLVYPHGTTFSADVLRHVLGHESGPRPTYVALVPTQLDRLLADPAVGSWLDGMTVLLGGAAAPPDLLVRAAEQGITVVTSYGSTETCGGCVYDGRPLTGVRTRLRPDGRLELGGAVIAAGYFGEDSGEFSTEPAPHSPSGSDPGTRWFTTSDLARIHPDGTVDILGRADDVIITGGEKVNPAAVERTLAEIAAGQVVVVGVPDPEWGERVVAVTTAPRPDLTRWRAHVRERMAGYAAPRQVVVVPELPLRGIGKPDRAAARELALRELATGGPAIREPAAQGSQDHAS